MPSKFTHLHTHSHYSLLDGLGKIPDLIARAKELKMDSLALTDHGVLYGAVEFYEQAVKAGIKPILGMEAYIAPKSRFDKAPGEKYYHLILLAENETGWHNLIKLSSRANLEGYYYKPRIDRELLGELHEGIIALSACMGGEVNSALLNNNIAEAEKLAYEYQDIFGAGNFYLELQHHVGVKDAENVRERAIALSKKTGLPLVATADLHYLRAEDSEYHDILLAVQTGNTIQDEKRMTLTEFDLSMASTEDMMERFADVPEAIENTIKIADRCNVTLELGTPLLPKFKTPGGMPSNDYLKQLFEERISGRYPGRENDTDVRERANYELGVIERTGFADYFLIVSDLVNWAKSQGIAVGPGRGSAAGSIVSYVLGITGVDPLQWDLLFERFLNPERIEMPDIDLDFADTRRDEVLDYARSRYGTDHVAQIITFGTMAARAAIRDSGRAMAIPLSLCDQIAKLVPGGPKGLDIKTARKTITELQELERDNADAVRLLDVAEHLEGVARHASVHACGTVISDRPLMDVVPVQMAPQNKDVIITQLDMRNVEKLGLLKIDLLGLRNLTTIEEALRLIRELRGENLNIDTIPLDDEATFELFRRADTTGVFQFESGGMRKVMKELQPTVFDDLVAVVALYRPGPMDLIPSFIARKNGSEKITYAHDKLEPVLKNTYGIGVYQEQMMRIATDLAGYTLPEADKLRKAIGKKIKSMLDEQEEKLIKGMVANGIDKRAAQAIWEMFPPFARYGFNKSHAVCYALIGYQTAYLRAHYPIEFMTAVFNADRHDIERIAVLAREALTSSITLLPPDVNQSGVTFLPESGNIRFGFSAIKNVGEGISQAIVEERAARGPFADLSDFVERLCHHKDLNKRSLDSLAKAGAMDCFGIERGALVANLDLIIQCGASQRKRLESHKSSLFGGMSQTAPKIAIELAPAPPADSKQMLTWEKELIGLFISDHPLSGHAETATKIGAISITDAIARSPESQVRVIGLVSKVRNIVTKAGQPMAFAMLEDLSADPIEVVVFSRVFEETRHVWLQDQVIAVAGKLQKRDDEMKLIADKAKVLTA
jgi:DNA polymerase-3 subunit alpha